MIPKVIHYVWVGGGAKPVVVEKCLASWRRHLKGYEIREWNETNFDIECNRYLREAYASRQWAFVSDYIRIHVVHQYGGVYLDSDCYVLGSLDPFLDFSFFTGFETDSLPFTAVFGAVPKHPLAARILRYYEEHPFLSTNGTPDMTTNTEIVGRMIRDEYHCRPNGHFQELSDGIAIYPDSVLCRFSRDSVVVHLMSGTWETMKGRERFLIRCFGGRASAELFRVTHPLLHAVISRSADFVNYFRKVN